MCVLSLCRFERRRLLRRGLQALYTHTCGRALASKALHTADTKGTQRRLWTGLRKLHR